MSEKNIKKIGIRDALGEYIYTDIGVDADKVDIDVSTNLAEKLVEIDNKFEDLKAGGYASKDIYGDEKINLGRKVGTAAGPYSVTIGRDVSAAGICSLAEGKDTAANGNYSHAEGSVTKASGHASHAEGYVTIAEGNRSHAEGYDTEARGEASHAEGYDTIAEGNRSHAEGSVTKAEGEQSHAEGYDTEARGEASHAEGYDTTAGGPFSHAEGAGAEAREEASHAEGQGTTAGGPFSHAEGRDTTAGGPFSHAEGAGAEASGAASHAEGQGTTARGAASHAEGYDTEARGTVSHAEGQDTTAIGYASHAEGVGTIAEGNRSHAEGDSTKAEGIYSHAEGLCTTAMANQHAQGHYNDTTLATANSTEGTGTGTAFVIGNGTSNSASNAFRVNSNGVAIGKSSFASSGADYAEYFEWKDGNTENEDRVGHFVTFADGKFIKKANEGDYILGIVSGMPCVIGNNDECWMKQFEMDEWGRFIYETCTEKDEETGEEKEYNFYKVNPDYNPTKPYTHREERPEWSAIGMVGVLSVRDDGTCEVNGYCKCSSDGIATACERGLDTFRVIERVTDNIVKVVIK